jgi:hypothetical protein
MTIVYTVIPMLKNALLLYGGILCSGNDTRMPLYGGITRPIRMPLLYGALQCLSIFPFCMWHYNAYPYASSVWWHYNAYAYASSVWWHYNAYPYAPSLCGITMPINMPLLYVALQCLSICPFFMWHYNAYPYASSVWWHYNAYPYAPSLCGITMPIHMPLLYGGITMPIHMPLLYVASQ